MNRMRTLRIGLLLVALAAVMTPRFAGADDRRALVRDAEKSMKMLLRTNRAAKLLQPKARAVLVFPNIVKAGFMFGGQVGDGVLTKMAAVAGYYNSVAASYGLQAGLQVFGYALFFMNDAALAYLDKSEGFELGCGTEHRRRRQGRGQVDDHHDDHAGCLRLHLRSAGTDGGPRNPGLEDHQALEVGRGATRALPAKKGANLMSKTRLLLAAVLILGLFAAALPAAEPAGDAAAQANLQVLLDAIRANRKALVAANLKLTNDEAVKFWPVYDRYQKETNALGDRLVGVIEDYSANFKTLSNDKAMKLVDDYLTIEADRVKVKRSYVDEFAKVLPGRTVARLFQIDNKMDAVIRYDLAATIPVVDEKGAAPAK